MIKEDHHFRRRPAPTTPWPVPSPGRQGAAASTSWLAFHAVGLGPDPQCSSHTSCQSNCKMVIGFSTSSYKSFLTWSSQHSVFPYCYKNYPASDLSAVNFRLNDSLSSLEWGWCLINPAHTVLQVNSVLSYQSTRLHWSPKSHDHVRDPRPSNSQCVYTVSSHLQTRRTPLHTEIFLRGRSSEHMECSVSCSVYFASDP